MSGVSHMTADLGVFPVFEVGLEMSIVSFEQPIIKREKAMIESGRILILPGNPLPWTDISDLTLSQRPVDFFMDDGIRLHVYSFTCKGSRYK